MIVGVVEVERGAVVKTTLSNNRHVVHIISFGEPRWNMQRFLTFGNPETIKATDFSSLPVITLDDIIYGFENDDSE